jgi:hypothetical protein
MLGHDHLSTHVNFSLHTAGPDLYATHTAVILVSAHLCGRPAELVLGHDHQATPVCILVDPGALRNVCPAEAAVK